MRRTNYALTAALIALLILLSSTAQAGGPLIINPDTKTAYHYAPGAVPVYYDLGNLGVVTDWTNYPNLSQVVFDNGVGRHVVEKGFGDWSSVPTSSFRATVVGDFSQAGLPNITGDNAAEVIGVFNGGGDYVIFDADGSVMSNFFGVGPNVLGISTPEFGEEGTSIITESWTVLNGLAIDPLDANAEQYQGVATHEFGHAIGLAHTQTNGAAYLYGPYIGENVGPQSCAGLPYPSSLTVADVETMYPFADVTFGTGTGIAQANIHTSDDMAALSDLYPGRGWPETYGTITGTILDLNGKTPLMGVNVIARNLADPFSDANSTISGQSTQGLFGPDGSFTLRGLKPGARYVVYVDAILAGGFPTPPMWFLPGPEKFYNGPAKGKNQAVDPCQYEAIVARQGGVVTADIKFDHTKGSPVLINLGYGAGGSDISDDGKTVVGNYGQGGPVFRWTEKTGIQTMNVLSTGEATFISPNGDFISSDLIDGAGNDAGAFRWDARSGWLSVAPTGSCGIETTDSYGVTNDGTVYGSAYKSCSDLKTFRWSPKAGTVLLPSATKKADGSGANGRPNQISADGSTLVGWEENEVGERHGVVWVNGVPSKIENEKGQWVSEGLSTSGDGSMISGMLFSDQEPLGAGWRRPVGSSELEYFGPLSPDSAPAMAFAMSRDGSVMAGLSGDPWFSFSPAPFLWTKEMGMANLHDFLRSQGTSMEQYTSLWTPQAMSNDGSVITGWGTGAQWFAGWVLQIPKAFVCHAPPRGLDKERTRSVGFPKEFDEHLAHGDTAGPCQDHQE